MDDLTAYQYIEAAADNERFAAVDDPRAESELERDSQSSLPPRSPYTSLADLEGSSVLGGVHRVKAVVSDTMGCKLRKKKYLVSNGGHPSNRKQSENRGEARTAVVFGNGSEISKYW